MAYILAHTYLGGKTYAARMYSFATKRDIVRCCGIVGANNASMAPASTDTYECHNYLPVLDKYILNDQKLVDIMSLVRLIWSGYYTHFEEGSYISSIKCNNPDFLNEKMSVYCYDENGEPYVTNNGSEEILINKYKHPTFVFCRLEDGRWFNYVAWKYFTTDSNIVFDGVPYIRVMESAVDMPQDAILPKYTGAAMGDRADALLRSTLQRDYANTAKKLLADPEVWASFHHSGLPPFDFLIQQASTRYSMDTIITKYPEIIEYDPTLVGGEVTPEIFQKLSEVVDDEKKHEVYIDKLFLRFYRSHLMLVDMQTRVLQLAAFENPTETVKTVDEISFPTATSYVTIKSPVSLLLMRSGRCFVDAITSLVTNMAGEGGAMSGALASAFQKSLQRCTESECIMIYSPMNGDATKKIDRKGKDPLSMYDLQNILNGWIYTTEIGDRQGETFLSERNWWLDSRLPEAKYRGFRYQFVDQKRHLVYGANCVYDFKNRKIKTYKDVGLNGPFDESLKFIGTASFAKLDVSEKSNKTTVFTSDGTIKKVKSAADIEREEAQRRVDDLFKL